MSDEEMLDELLDRWEALVEKQERVDLAELCRDAPHLLPELTRRAQSLGAIDSILSIHDSGIDSSSKTRHRQTETHEDIAAAIKLINAGRYVPVSFLAEGGLGRLFVARDTELDRDVVLKLIKNETLADFQTRKRFEFEAQITSQLDHPGIVPVFGFGRDDRTNGRQYPYYAMRLIRGKRLQDAIQEFHAVDRSASEYNVELQRLLRCFLTVCETIAFAHNRNIIHRDLKPANIMLGEYGETLVVDWGLAKMIGQSDEANRTTSAEIPPPKPNPTSQTQMGQSSLTQMGEMKGTLAYMSSEQARGQWDLVDRSSDIYSLGAILYTLLTGQKAFQGRDEYRVYEDVISGRFTPPRQVSRRIPVALEQVCLKAMNLDRQRRYATATELARDLEQWLADEPVTAWREPWNHRLRRWCKRHFTSLISASAAMLVAIVGLTLTTFLLGEKNQQLQVANNLAESHFQQANHAVRDIVDQACGNALFRRPGMHPAQESLLRVALEYYRQFIKQRSNDPGLQIEMLRTRLVIASIVHDIRTPLEAEAEYEAVSEFLDPLLKGRAEDQARREPRPSERAEDPELREAFALVRSRQSQIDCELGRIDANASHFADSDAAYRKLLDESPQDSRLRLAYANAVFLQGEETGDLNLLRRAQGLIETDRPGIALSDASILLARICSQIGLLEMRSARLNEAAESLKHAEESLATFQHNSPSMDSPDLEAIHAAIALNRGRLAKMQGDPATALSQIMQARKGFDLLVRRDPEIGEYHVRLATTFVELGKLSVASGQGDQARQELTAARDELNAQPNTTLRMLDRYELARCLLDLGEATLKAGDTAQASDLLTESQRRFEALVATNPSNPDYHRNLAAIWNQMAAISQRAGDVEACVAALENAVKESEPIVASHPERPEFLNALAKISFNLGMVHSSQSDWDEAWTWLKKSRAHYDAEVSSHPEIPEYQADRIQFLKKFIEICNLRRGSDPSQESNPDVLRDTLNAFEALQKNAQLTPEDEESMTRVRDLLKSIPRKEPEIVP